MVWKPKSHLDRLCVLLEIGMTLAQAETAFRLSKRVQMVGDLRGLRRHHQLEMPPLLTLLQVRGRLGQRRCGGG